MRLFGVTLRRVVLGNQPQSSPLNACFLCPPTKMFPTVNRLATCLNQDALCRCDICLPFHCPDCADNFADINAYHLVIAILFRSRFHQLTCVAHSSTKSEAFMCVLQRKVHSSRRLDPTLRIQLLPDSFQPIRRSLLN